MKYKIKCVFSHFAVFLILISVLYFAMVLSTCIPNYAINKNMRSSAEYYASTDAFSFEKGRQWRGISDNYADAILINIAYNAGVNQPLRSVIESKYYSGGENGVNAGLYYTVNEGALPDKDYSRYWHGGVIPVRIGHLFWGVSGIKRAGGFAIIALAILCIAFLIKNKNSKTAIAFAIAALSIGISGFFLSLEYQSCFIIGFAMCFAFLITSEKHESWLTYLSVVAGVLVAFFDFLTCETVVLLLPLALVVSKRWEDGRAICFKSMFKLILICVISFSLAYAGTFLVKWTLATIISGENKFITALSSAGERMGVGLSYTQASNVFESLYLSIISNLSAFFGGGQRVDLIAALVGTSVTAVVYLSALYLFMKKDSEKDPIKLLLILSCGTLMRFVFLAAHSYQHCFFTYRALITPVFSLISILMISAKPARRKK